MAALEADVTTPTGSLDHLDTAEIATRGHSLLALAAMGQGHAYKSLVDPKLLVLYNWEEDGHHGNVSGSPDSGYSRGCRHFQSRN